MNELVRSESSNERWPNEQELDALVRGFETRSLPKHEWTHEAHLAVGTWHSR